MKIEIINADEEEKTTIVFINESFSLLPDSNIMLVDCRFYQRGKYMIVEYLDKVYYWEHVGEHCYLVDAIHYMNLDLPARWKTLRRLITFRQAIRENYAQGMGLEDLLKENITWSAFNEFIDTARLYDKRKYGVQTF